VWRRLNLRIRIYLLIAMLIMITVMGGVVMVWYTYRMEGLLTRLIDRNMASFQTAEALETALVNQKGYVSYYLLEKDPEWLRQLGEHRQIFKERLNEARDLVEDEAQRRAVEQIASEYHQYVESKDQVIALYQSGQVEAGAELHRQVRKHFNKILELTAQYKDLHSRIIDRAKSQSHAQAESLRGIAASALILVLLIGLLLISVLVNHILGPLRQLAMEAGGDGALKRPGDEVKVLSSTVRGLIKDIDDTHEELERSREHLLQAEKMALVGKLAAGMAHSIRNPLTSVKMRLFSLGRSLDLSAIQKEDLEVISEEVRHLDTIVENFLEFSRPPKLKMQKISPSEVVDVTLRLLQHRLESYNVRVKTIRQRPLPEIKQDPEQLKEVLVNLVVNACEAMDSGGSIVIQEEEDHVEPLGRVVVIRVSDTGPGIPSPIKERIFQPFFTTKEEGTGLGLSIASRIVEEHGGWLDVSSEDGKGTTFVLTLPVKE
jgi:signal transduction histidine kinase